MFIPCWIKTPVGPSLLIIEATQPHSDTPHSVGLLWTSDHVDTETYTWQQTTQLTDRHTAGDIRTRNPNKLVTTEPPLKPREHSDRLLHILRIYIAVSCYWRQESVELHNRHRVLRVTCGLTYLLTYCLAACCTVLIGKLTVFQPVKKSPCILCDWSFITAFTSARQLSLSWASSIQSIHHILIPAYPS